MHRERCDGMPEILVAYVRAVEAFNRRIGRIAMYLLFALMGVMLFGALSRAAWVPQSWTDEMGQFLLVGYFMLGGAYAMQLGSAVRMDVFYSAWSDRTKAAVDAVTIFALIFYLGVLLWGGIESTQYALEYGERRRGLWRPYMAPIKIIMVIGIVMMLLQCTAFFIRDVARLRGRII
jgi:TRAP-type mannitol/chloroaromatic compound transport system permease small subunit